MAMLLNPGKFITINTKVAYLVRVVIKGRYLFLYPDGFSLESFSNVTISDKFMDITADRRVLASLVIVENVCIVELLPLNARFSVLLRFEISLSTEQPIDVPCHSVKGGPCSTKILIYQ